MRTFSLENIEVPCLWPRDYIEGIEWHGRDHISHYALEFFPFVNREQLGGQQLALSLIFKKKQLSLIITHKYNIEEKIYHGLHYTRYIYGKCI
jgi:hypothetical protein